MHRGATVSRCSPHLIALRGATKGKHPGGGAFGADLRICRRRCKVEQADGIVADAARDPSSRTLKLDEVLAAGAPVKTGGEVSREAVRAGRTTSRATEASDTKPINPRRLMDRFRPTGFDAVETVAVRVLEARQPRSSVSCIVDVFVPLRVPRVVGYSTVIPGDHVAPSCARPAARYGVSTGSRTSRKRPSGGQF